MSSVVTKPLARAGIFLGVGLGGFVDGIVFHQILQLHGMLTARLPKDTVPNIQINMFWDGMFHLFTWLMTMTGVLLLFQAKEVREILWSGRVLGGAMIFGWGVFNVIEGLVNHHILHLHHVVESRGESVFDSLFLASGLVFMGIGWLVMRSHRARAWEVHA